jgi:hypothetical protein
MAIQLADIARVTEDFSRRGALVRIPGQSRLVLLEGQLNIL